MPLSSVPSERVTVTLPAQLVAGIDRLERNRSRFIPHPDSLANAALGQERWREGLPTADSDPLDPTAGVPVHGDREQGLCLALELEPEH